LPEPYSSTLQLIYRMTEATVKMGVWNKNRNVFQLSRLIHIIQISSLRFLYSMLLPITNVNLFCTQNALLQDYSLYVSHCIQYNIRPTLF
jgi:hypothetical protein